jgi:hypothetical protein
MKFALPGVEEGVFWGFDTGDCCDEGAKHLPFSTISATRITWAISPECM